MTATVKRLVKTALGLAIAAVLAFGAIEALTPAEPAHRGCDDCANQGGDTFCEECCAAENSMCHVPSGQCICA